MKKITFRILATALVATSTAFAASIPNPSFETDTFTVFPGYVSGNAPITGWTSNNDGRTGLNPSGGTPFANNGVIPDGNNVAFIQSNSGETPEGVTLNTVISDLEIGTTYRVSFRVNARTGQAPKVKVEIDGAGILNTGISAVGGVNPYKYFAFEFTAAAVSQTMTLRNDAVGDHTALVDDFSIAPSDTGWSYAAWTDDTTAGVDNTKHYTHAYSFANAGSTTVIEGIEFTGIGGANPSTPLFSTAGFQSVFPNDSDNNISGNSAILANDFLYGGPVQSITLNGLLTGGEYVANIYSTGWEDGTRAATFSVGDDRLTVNQDHFGLNNGIRFTYQFVATSSSITLTFAQLEGNSIHTYGFSNYELSAPPVPTIAIQPLSQSVGAGETVTFTVSAGGSEPLVYQWRKDTVDLPGENLPTLTLFGVTTADDGVYSVFITNEFGTTLSSNATLQVGLAIVNRSFEEDAFFGWPGYVNLNGPIIGWTSLGDHGINPLRDGLGSPFADNGAIPDGQQVAFMQGNGALSQPISGFVIGSDYYVVYYENARSVVTVPSIEVKIGDKTIVAAHPRPPVGGNNSYVRMVSDVFTAEAETLELAFIKSNPQGGDSTALIDNVVVFALPPNTAASIVAQPGPQTVQLGETATFSVSAFGSQPLTYQWLKGGEIIPGATSGTFSITNAMKADEANYSVTVSNSFGGVISSNAFLSVWEPIGDLYNTGLDNNRLPLAGGLNDPHYVLTANPDGEAPTNSTVESNIPGAWLANTASSRWVGPRADTVASEVGEYVYRLTFDLTNRDPATVVIEGRWATDNGGLGIRVNDVETGNANTAQFNAWTSFTISTSNASFGPGLNTIDFVVDNSGAIGFTGLRVEFLRSNARVLPNIAPFITSHPATQIIVEGDGATLGVTASGSAPLSYQWSRNGQTLVGQTNQTLTLTNQLECDSADYTVTVSNEISSVVSSVGSVIVAYQRVPGIFGTGLNGDGTLADNGSVDLHYILGSSADGNFPGPDAIVVTDTQFPISTGNWLASGPDSKWIAPQADQNAGNAEGNYTYQTFFDLTGVDISRFRLVGGWAVDNGGIDILVNGISTGNTSAGFGSLAPFVITSGFVSGSNSVDFVMSNAPVSDNPTGLRVDLAGLIDIRPRMTVTPTGVNQVSVEWGTNACHRLQSASSITGPWTTIQGAANPFVTNTTSQQFFRVAP